jgi:hypothetical protein
MVGLSPGHCAAPDIDVPLSPTHPATATQSAATASAIPADLIQTDCDTSSSLSRRRPTASVFAADVRGYRPPNLKSKPSITSE